MAVEDLEVCDLTHQWPVEERYELGAKIIKQFALSTGGEE